MRAAEPRTELPLFDAPPSIVLDLPIAVLVFAASWSAPSIAMVGRVTSVVEECGRTLARACPVVVLDADSPAGLACADRLGVAVLGWGETCWLARGDTVARADVLATDGILRQRTVELVSRTWPARDERPTLRARPR